MQTFWMPRPLANLAHYNTKWWFDLWIWVGSPRLIKCTIWRLTSQKMWMYRTISLTFQLQLVINWDTLSRLSLSEKYGQFGYWWYSKFLSFWVEYRQYLNLLCTDISINYIYIEWNTTYANEPHRIHTLAHFFLHDSMNYQWLK